MYSQPCPSPYLYFKWTRELSSRASQGKIINYVITWNLVRIPIFRSVITWKTLKCTRIPDLNLLWVSRNFLPTLWRENHEIRFTCSFIFMAESTKFVLKMFSKNLGHSKATECSSTWLIQFTFMVLSWNYAWWRGSVVEAQSWALQSWPMIKVKVNGHARIKLLIKILKLELSRN